MVDISKDVLVFNYQEKKVFSVSTKTTLLRQSYHVRSVWHSHWLISKISQETQHTHLYLKWDPYLTVSLVSSMIVNSTRSLFQHTFGISFNKSVLTVNDHIRFLFFEEFKAFGCNTWGDRLVGHPWPKVLIVHNRNDIVFIELAGVSNAPYISYISKVVFLTNLPNTWYI